MPWRDPFKIWDTDPRLAALNYLCNMGGDKHLVGLFATDLKDNLSWLWPPVDAVSKWKACTISRWWKVFLLMKIFSQIVHESLPKPFHVRSKKRGDTWGLILKNIACPITYSQGVDFSSRSGVDGWGSAAPLLPCTVNLLHACTPSQLRFSPLPMEAPLDQLLI